MGTCSFSVINGTKSGKGSDLRAWPPHENLYLVNPFPPTQGFWVAKATVWSRWRMKKITAKARVSGKILKSEPLRMHSQNSGAKMRVFERNTDVFKFWLF